MLFLMTNDYSFVARIAIPGNPYIQSDFVLKLYGAPDGFVFMPPYEDSGFRKELVLIYGGRIPTPDEEPNLFSDDRWRRTEIDGDLKIETSEGVVVFLSTAESDASVLKAHPEYIRNELFRYIVTDTELEPQHLL